MMIAKVIFKEPMVVVNAKDSKTLDRGFDPSIMEKARGTFDDPKI
jgi:hypothetical protein